MTIKAHVTKRLLELIAAGGHNPHSLSVKMGWSHARIASKLLASPTRPDGSPNKVYRTTDLTDVDEILAALGLDASAILNTTTTKE